MNNFEEFVNFAQSNLNVEDDENENEIKNEGLVQTNKDKEDLDFATSSEEHELPLENLESIITFNFTDKKNELKDTTKRLEHLELIELIVPAAQLKKRFRLKLRKLKKRAMGQKNGVPFKGNKKSNVAAARKRFLVI